MPGGTLRVAIRSARAGGARWGWGAVVALALAAIRGVSKHPDSGKQQSDAHTKPPRRTIAIAQLQARPAQARSRTTPRRLGLDGGARSWAIAEADGIRVAAC